MANDDKFIITAEQAESLLIEGSETVHNFVQAGPVLMGCDYQRDRAIEAFHAAKLIEIGGPGCKQLKHPIVVHEADGDYSFFEADMEKVEALEAAREKAKGNA